MHPAPLVSGALEAAPDRGDQPGMLVGDHQPHPGQAAAFQRGQELAPKHFVLAVTDIDTKDLPTSLSGHTR